MTDEPCRIDVWLWRARFFKTRALACKFVEGGKVRVSRIGAQTRLDKASRTVRPGDGLVFAIGGRLFDIRVEGVGDRRGPASEARALYFDLSPPPCPQTTHLSAPPGEPGEPVEIVGAAPVPVENWKQAKRGFRRG